MRTVPVWIDDAPIRKFPKLHRNIDVDVLVIGAGVTGITVGYLLKEAGLTVALISRRVKKVAAFGGDNGKIHRLSPVCTHLACLSRRNPSKTTWDCPSHGSRFKNSGEVMAGPGEEPLSPM